MNLTGIIDMQLKEVPISKPFQANIKQMVKRLTKVQGASIFCEMLMRKQLTMLKRSLSRKVNMMEKMGGWWMLMQENQRLGREWSRPLRRLKLKKVPRSKETRGRPSGFEGRGSGSHVTNQTAPKLLHVR